MEYNPEIHNRRSIRLKEYDYSQEGYYYVTICTKNMERWFGNVVNGKMKLSDIGEIVKFCWHDLPNHYAFCKLDEFVIMPNHVHGIIVIDRESFVGAGLKLALTKPAPTMKRHGLFEIIRAFKTFSSRKINDLQKSLHFQWHRNYYEHIIRNEKELYFKRKYIINNPLKWDLDENNPAKF